MVKKNIAELSLEENEKEALEKLKLRILEMIPGSDIILFGSRARDGGTVYSDLDVLILVDTNVDHGLRERINDIAYGIELEHDVVFGKIVHNRDNWHSPLIRATPLNMNIEKEGISL